MITPRFGFAAVGGESADIDNLRLAATIYAFDVPLRAEKPYSTTAGDGINGTRVVWHFIASAGGNSPGEIAKRWHDDRWIEMNPAHPVAVCKNAFLQYSRLIKAVKERSGFDLYYGADCSVQCTYSAAILLALGHHLHGWRLDGDAVIWKFHQSAAADAALLADRNLYDKLPDATVSYARGALLGHRYMVDHIIRSVGQARVEHRGRTAIIGRNAPKRMVDELEKLLYRK